MPTLCNTSHFLSILAATLWRSNDLTARTVILKPARRKSTRLAWRKKQANQQLSVGLGSDGTVTAVGDNKYGQCNVSGWRDIVAVAAGCAHTLGLTSGGTVVAVGDNEYGQCDVSGWRGIQLPGNYRHGEEEC